MAYHYECPTNDWFCPYFDNGACDAFFGIVDDDSYALD